MELNKHLEGLSLLVVENEFLLAISLEAIVRDAGARRVKMAATVANATDLANRETFDAVILDIRLMDGESLPLAIELSERGVPVVIHSGHATTAHCQMVPQAVFLQKPATPVEIVQAVLKARGVPAAFELRSIATAAQ